MQRHTDEGVELLCDFCETAWDERLAMIEGHRGSILCIHCLEHAIEAAVRNEDSPDCTMCLRPAERDAGVFRAANGAVLCRDCMRQADRTFAKDPDTPWDRRLAPTDRWR